MSEFLKIGVSSCFFHPDPKRPTFKNKTLLYFEESMVKMVLYYDAIPLVLPRASGGISVRDILSQVDGLLLQGGADVSPTSYGEKPFQPEWEGDKIRDEYEIALVQEAISMKLPILGICRGLQILNTALGGSLYQDIQTQLENASVHRNWDIYDQLTHEIVIEPKTYLHQLYQNISERKIISVHHQAIRKLGKDLIVEARSKEDGIIEAIRYQPDKKEVYAFGVQWHPEFQNQNDTSLMTRKPVLQDFLEAVKKRKSLSSFAG